MRVGAFGILFAFCLSLTGQDRYASLRDKLGVADSQTGPLSAAQQRELADIAKVWERSDLAAAAIVMGLIDPGEWPAPFACPLYQIAAYTRQFNLTAAQVTRLEELQNAARQPNLERQWELQRRHRALLESGAPENSSEIAAVMSDLTAAMNRYAKTRPPRDPARSVLNAAQQAKLATFEAELELAREALELHLIELPASPEVLCH